MSDNAGWVGWYRWSPGQPWERLSEAPTLDECCRLLWQAARRRGSVRNGDLFLTTGHAPVEGRPAAGGSR